MKLNTSMVTRWAQMSIRESLNDSELERGLVVLAEAAIIDSLHGIVLEPLYRDIWDQETMVDETGFEAFINKVHISDFLQEEEPTLKHVIVQGVLYGNALHARLQTIRGRFRVLLSLDPVSSEVTVRFHKVRPGAVWIAEDPNEYKHEDVVIWDTVCARP